jgi:hypothetical protein
MGSPQSESPVGVVVSHWPTKLMDFTQAIEALKSRPLTSDPGIYEAVQKEMLKTKGSNICPELWSWLAQVQVVSDARPLEASVQAITDASSHLLRNKAKLNVEIEVIAKLLMNVLLKLLNFDHVLRTRRILLALSFVAYRL